MSGQLKAQVDKLLTNVSNGLFAKGCVAEQIFPSIKSKQYSGLLGKYGNQHLRLENAVKGGRGRFRQVETMVNSTQQYLIEGHGLEGLVTKEDYANKEQPFDAEKDEVMGLQTMLLIEKEVLMAGGLTNTSVITQNVTLSGTGQFSDYVNSDPLAVISTARGTIIDAVGQAPNVAIMDIKVWDKLRYHPKFLTALGYQYARPGGLSRQELATALDVDKLLVAECRYNTAKEGQADVLAPVWGKDIVLAVAPDSAQPYQQSGGYLVVPEGSSPRKVYKQDNFNPPGSTSILCEDEYDILLSTVAGIYVVKAAIA